MRLGETPIGEVEIDKSSRDDIPALLQGLQYLYVDKARRNEVFNLLQSNISSDISQLTGRPGMELWPILVLAVLKHGLDCDFDRLQELANQHRTLRKMLGHVDWQNTGHQYNARTLINNLPLITPKTLSKVGQLVVTSEHEVAKKLAWRKIAQLK